MITQEYLKSLFHYNPETGHFTWKTRSESSLKNPKQCNRLNARFAEKIAGHIHSKGYRYISIDKKAYQAHRLAWLYLHGEFPKYQIDHINGEPGDNRIANLRCVTNSENQKNSRLRINNNSRCTGVFLSKISGKWLAQINNKGQQIYLGIFEDKFQAICARKSAENRYGYHRNHGRR